MKILISGTKGSIGSELVKILDSPAIISLRYNKIDTQQKAQLSNCDVFIHCGALLDGSFNDTFQSNFLLTKQLLDFLEANNPSVHVIFLSSMSLLKGKKTILYNDFANFEEMSDYAFSKYFTEAIFTRYNIHHTIVRFSTLFYKDPTKDGLSKLTFDAVKKKEITLVNKGMAERDWIPLEIASQYIKKLIGNTAFIGKTLNIVSGEEKSFMDIAQFLKSQINKLTIKNINQETLSFVPHSFSVADILSIGKIEFNLHDNIHEYVQRLEI